ncbi:hypothetical protein BCR39DRAFT_152444 [Naematelia encephala]|uniref:Homeobox domain-containing protein n=1 Tax=Naematelia encephala TaxID=71784 RepID=A0A1Y2B6Q2_9TREE|nr:hypothetical protein BCR39DRAFT_152444 [Naematelia encephala]
MSLAGESHMQTKRIPCPTCTKGKADPPQVKHRRRTTPEQLKVLEHWFDVNPKPDNNLREWLASELGMTKRNIQVWFQNRRAKVKGLAMKEKAAQTKASASGSDSENPPGNSTADPPSSDRKPANASTTSQRPVIEPLTIIPPVSNTVPRHVSTVPRPPLISQPASQPAVQQMLLPPVNTVNMGRRVSLANGEAAMIETWVAKRMAAGRNNANRAAGIPGFSPRSPSMGTAAAARRASIPYPPPINANGTFAFPQTAMSPLTRPMPSTLYLAAMRNNTRRSSVPGIPPVGTAQLISSAPFTPPRIGSGSYQVPSSTGRSTRDLSPIKDVDHDSGAAHSQPSFVFDEPASDLSATYLSTPVSTYAPNPNGGSTEAPFAPNAPLPNPAFSFGAPPDNNAQPAISDEEIHLWMTLQRGRLSSMASINSTYAESAGTQDGSDHTVEWNSGLVESSPQPNGFEADARRASA